MLKKLLVSVVLVLVLGIGAVSAHEGEAHSRVRVAHFAVDAPAVDVYVDGQRVLEDLAYTSVSPYSEMEAGTHHLLVVAASATTDNAVIEEDVEIEEGHSYTIAAIGQMADDSFGPMVIDETQALADEGLAESLTPVILVNAISNSPSVDIFAGGQPFLQDIQFGNFKAIEFPLTVVPIHITVAGEPDQTVLDENFFGVPNTLTVAAIMGSYPDNFTRVLVNTTEMKALEFLAAASGGPVLSFDKFLGAIGIVAQSDVELPAIQPNSTLFAPTDAAFEDVPVDTLNNMMAEPETLANVLLYHGVQGPLLVNDILVGLFANGGSFAVTTANGEDIVFTANENGLFINSDQAKIIYPDVLAADGTIQIIDGVLVPPA